MSTTVDKTNLNSSRTMHALLKIDSSIRSGQFIYAHRQACKLLADIMKGEHDVSPVAVESLVSSVKRTVLMLKSLIASYAQNQASIDIVRRASQCQKTQPSVQ